MESMERAIPARTAQEAMDWSLVLVSQDIRATIQEPDDEQGWRLNIPAENYHAALAAIRQYRLENRQTRWHQALPGGDLILDWRALGWCLLLLLFHALASRPGWAWSAAGVMDADLVRSGAWWRVFTATMLHADLGHLMSNVVIGGLFLGLAMGVYGFGWAWAAAWLAGAAANGIGVLLHPGPFQSLGASGVVMGALGLLAVASLSSGATSAGPHPTLLRGISAGLLLLILLGLDPRTDVVAHAGGFAWGAVAGIALRWIPERWRISPLPNHLAEISVAAGMVLTWKLALAAPLPV